MLRVLVPFIASAAIILTGCESSRVVSDTQLALSADQRTAIADTIRTMTGQVLEAGQELASDEMANYFTNSPYAAFAAGGELMISTEAVRASLEAGYASLEEQNFQPGETRIVVFTQDAAVLTGTGSFISVDTTGAAAEGIQAYTLVWARREGDWSIVQSHFSSRLLRVGEAPADSVDSEN